jgi:hypothetical protein
MSRFRDETRIARPAGYDPFKGWAPRCIRTVEAATIARKAANYQAWQVVNTAQGKGGSGGRIDALQDLNRNEVSLAGVQLDGAWLEGLSVPHADLRRATLRGANLRGADLRGANLELADLTGADLTGANLTGAVLKDALVARVSVMTADFRGADVSGLRGWDAIARVLPPARARRTRCRRAELRRALRLASAGTPLNSPAGLRPKTRDRRPKHQALASAGSWRAGEGSLKKANSSWLIRSL